MTEETLFGIVVVLFFIWRFARTHQLYRYSLKTLKEGVEPTKIEISFSREFFDKVLLGNRDAKPSSFMIRAMVFLVVALVLFPFRNYAPELYWVVSFLIVLYVPWCVGHGLLLRSKGQNSS